jgi:hypothetical protein
MARKQHTEDEVLIILKKKHDVHINRNNKSIHVNTLDNPKNDLGNGSWGKIDFLTKYCGYSISYN